MQKYISIFNKFRINQKFTLFLLLSFSAALPIQASDSEKLAVENKAKESTFSKRKKIKKINDLRIIVDISGSMKKTDPNNLRRSAIRLLAGLIPKGSRAGIWNFGKQVNMSVKIGEVNDTWRSLARAQSKKISSAGLYTNIESVMRKASFDWRNPDPGYMRNIIILTDGHVDISKDEKLNKASRKRILKEVLPKFEKAQARIHTIALSDDVDESLLSTLSAYTDGLYKKVHSADDLQKIFLQMLEQSIKLDTLPINNNKFNVDASINDMTLLIFNKDKSHPTAVITPENKKWNSNEHPNKVKWFSDEGYDLITIKKPEKGEWKIKAPLDPNNRVVVATNLKLKSNDIPSYLILGNSLNVAARLEEDGKPLSDQRLLSKFDFMLERDAGNSSERHYPLTKNDNDKFSYSVKLNSAFKEGNNEIIIRAKSPTAEREVRHQFKVYTTPANIKVSKNNDKYKVEVTPYVNVMRPETIKVNVVLKDNIKHVLTKNKNNWMVEIDEEFLGSLFKINITATGADGKPLKMSFDKILSVEGGAKKLDLAAKFEKQRQTEDELAKKEKNTKEEKDAEQNKKNSDKPVKRKQTSVDEGDAVKEINWVFIVSSVVIGNLLLAGILGGGYVFMKRRKEKLIKNAEEEIAGDGNKSKVEKDSESKKDSPPKKEEKAK